MLTLESILNIECDEGYHVTPGIADELVVCMEGGVWRPDPLVTANCTRISCEEPPEIEDAHRAFTTTFYGDEVTYTCPPNYLFDDPISSGTVTVKCVGHNTWSPNMEGETCKQVFCDTGIKPVITNAVFTNSSGTVYGSYEFYTCNKGFHYLDNNNKSHPYLKCLGVATALIFF
ncbi:membrane cofactor protein-like [Ciona intestinalis]